MANPSLFLSWCQLLKFHFVQGLMRVLAHNGIFVILENNNEESEVAYDLTPASPLLVNRTNHCLCSMLQWGLDPGWVDMLQHLAKWVRSEDLTLPQTTLEVGYWDFLSQNPAYMITFNEAMASDSLIINCTLPDLGFVFEGSSSIVDVGGGTGITAQIICEAFLNLKCTVFELPKVVANLSSENSNLSSVGGDMLISTPHADAVMLKVLHNRSNNDCIKILKNAKEVIPGRVKGGKVFIIDAAVDEKQDEHQLLETKLLFHTHMMAVHNAKERTEEE